MAKNLPGNAGNSGSIPSQGTKIPHAAKQLSPITATQESMLKKKKKRIHAHNRKIPQVAKKILCAATKTGSSQINK